MLFHNTDIPSKLVDASRNGNLVIFAGAGVSKQDPLKFPDFNSLVSLIKSEVDLADRMEPFNKDSISCEQYLAHLESRYDIRSVAAKLLDTAGKTTELHKNIIRLFPSNDTVRIVTTNFDNAFECALDALQIDRIKRYFCPALPVGNSFSGIVYAHGSIHEKNDMVLTSADFGKAYVTQGWASRFLVSLFSQYTVLFIGYSCQDILVDYLTRSISSEMRGHVYTLAQNEKDVDAWKMRGVEVISFEEYTDLPLIFKEWSDHNKTTTFQRIKRIHEIAGKEHLSEEDRSFLLESLNWEDARNRSVFSREFFDQSKSISHLRFLLDNKRLISDELRNFGFTRWICEAFAVAHFHDLQQVLLPLRNELPREFYEQLLWSLSHSNSSARCVGSWLPWLETLPLKSKGFCRYHLIELIKRQYAPTITESLLRIALRVDMDSEYKYSSSSLAPTLCIDEDSFREELVEASADIPLSNRQSLARYCIEQLEAAYLIQTEYETDVGFDSISFGRSAIEPHEQDRYNHEAIQSLIDIARNLCKDLDCDEIRSLCLGSCSNIAQRIGIWVLKEKQIDSNSLNLAIEYRFIENLYLRHEAFCFLREAFPVASREDQVRFIEYSKKTLEGDDSESTDYSYFNLFTWLNDEAKSPLLSAEIESILKRNPNFQKREHPDLTTYTSVGWINTEKDCEIALDDFTPEGMMRRMHAERRPGSFASKYDIVSTPTKQYPDTALSVVRSMIQCADLSEDEILLCRLIVRAFPWKSYFGDSQDAVDAFLEFIPDKRIAEECIRAFYFTTETAPEQLLLTLPQRETIANAIFEQWEYCFEDEVKGDGAHNNDWFSYGINTTRGMIVSLITKLLFEAESENHRLSKNLTIDSFEKVLLNILPLEKQHSKAVIAVVFSYYSRWCSIDFDFCNRHFVPILEEADWGSEAAWHGLAHDHYITKDSWKSLSRSWINALDKFTLSEGDHQNALIDRFSFGVLNYENAQEKKRLFAKCCTSSEQACQHALFRIKLWVEELSEEKQRQEWDNWINDLCLYIAGQEPVFKKFIGESLARWIERCPSIRTRIAALLKRIGPIAFDNGLFVREGTLTSIANGSIENSDKSTLLVFLLKGQSFFHHQEDVESALDLLNPREMEESDKNNLMDTLSIIGMTEQAARWNR